jgi:hypothetical protein
LKTLLDITVLRIAGRAARSIAAVVAPRGGAGQRSKPSFREERLSRLRAVEGMC